jgi:hypothetical protein
MKSTKKMWKSKKSSSGTKYWEINQQESRNKRRLSSNMKNSCRESKSRTAMSMLTSRKSLNDTRR